MALSGLSSVVTSKYRNLVGDYEIAYDVKQNTGEKADKVLGSIKKGDLKKGYILCEMDGRKSITCLILIQVDTFISNNKMCFDYGKEEASSKNK